MNIHQKLLVIVLNILIPYTQPLQSMPFGCCFKPARVYDYSLFINDSIISASFFKNNLYTVSKNIPIYSTRDIPCIIENLMRAFHSFLTLQYDNATDWDSFSKNYFLLQSIHSIIVDTNSLEQDCIQRELEKKFTNITVTFPNKIDTVSTPQHSAYLFLKVTLLSSIEQTH